MRAVAERGVLRVLAGAPSHFFGLGDHDLLGGEAGAFVRTITERLVLRIAAGTPVVGFRSFYLDRIRTLLGNDGI